MMKEDTDDSAGVLPLTSTRHAHLQSLKALTYGERAGLHETV